MARVIAQNDVQLSIVIPIYNNASCLDELWRQIRMVLSEAWLEDYEIIFVDDSSSDESREILRGFCAKDSRVKLIGLSRNFGHQLAITAGYDSAKGEAVLVMDGDLQDPPEVIPQFLAKWREGYDIVYGVREARLGESAFKRQTSTLFYRMLRRLAHVNIPPDAGDFRLLSRRAADALNTLRERHRYVRGMVSWLGFRQTPVYYQRAPRWAGKSEYSLSKLVGLALDGIFSFSRVPLRIAIWLGLIGAGISLVYMVFAIASKLIWGVPMRGWASLVTLIVFIGSIQLIVLGILGEYVGRIYEEQKRRPLYLIDEQIGFKA